MWVCLCDQVLWSQIQFDFTLIWHFRKCSIRVNRTIYTFMYKDTARNAQDKHWSMSNLTSKYTHTHTCVCMCYVHKLYNRKTYLKGAHKVAHSARCSCSNSSPISIQFILSTLELHNKVMPLHGNCRVYSMWCQTIYGFIHHHRRRRRRRCMHLPIPNEWWFSSKSNSNVVDFRAFRFSNFNGFVLFRFLSIFSAWQPSQRQHSACENKSTPKTKQNNRCVASLRYFNEWSVFINRLIRHFPQQL